MTVLRVILSKPHLGARAPKYEARLEDESVLLCVSREPEFAAARALLGLGYAPEELMTTRWEGSAHDAIVPATLGHLAKWTVKERDKSGLQVERWQPQPQNAVSSPRGASQRAHEGATGSRTAGQGPNAPASGHGRLELKRAENR
jgi:hypothetical protein